MPPLYSDDERRIVLNRAVAALALKEDRILKEIEQGLFKAGGGDQMAKVPGLFALWHDVVDEALALDQKEADHQLAMYDATSVLPDLEPYSATREAEVMAYVNGQLQRLANALNKNRGKLGEVLKRMRGHVEALRVQAECDAKVRIPMAYKERHKKFGLAVLQLQGRIRQRQIEETEREERRRRERIERVNPKYLAVKQTFPDYPFMADADPAERRAERCRRFMALGRAMAEEGFPMPEHLVDNPSNPCWQAKELLRMAFTGDAAGVDRILHAAEGFSMFVASDFWITIKDDLEELGLRATVEWPRQQGAGGAKEEVLSKSVVQAEVMPPPAPSNNASFALMRVFTNGIADDRIEKATQLLADDHLTANEKLTKIDALIPFPATASAEQLGEMLGVTKQAVLKTDWWIQNRRGEKDNEIGKRRAGHQKRAKDYEPPGTTDDDE